MHIDLTQKPHAPTIIVGFPGVGLVGPIVTEFLIDHLQTEQIGLFVYDELPPTAAIHKGKLVHPMSVHYSRQHNIIIIYTILPLKKYEWRVANAISIMAQELAAKELLCIDGAASEEGSKIYAYGSEQLIAAGAAPLEESVLNGVSGALLLTHPTTRCIFAATHSDMPDSKAAADIVKFLDKYLSLIVDYQPLMQQAAAFEEKLKTLLAKSQAPLSEQERKHLDYLG